MLRERWVRDYVSLMAPIIYRNVESFIYGVADTLPKLMRDVSADMLVKNGLLIRPLHAVLHDVDILTNSPTAYTIFVSRGGCLSYRDYIDKIVEPTRNVRSMGTYYQSPLGWTITIRMEEKGGEFKIIKSMSIIKRCDSKVLPGFKRPSDLKCVGLEI